MRIALVVDTSPSMAQRGQAGLSLLDAAKAACEHFLKLRSRDPEAQGDTVTLYAGAPLHAPLHQPNDPAVVCVTCPIGDASPLAHPRAASSSHPRDGPPAREVTRALRSLSALSSPARARQALKCALFDLEASRAVSGADSIGHGTSAVRVDPSVVLVLTDGGMGEGSGESSALEWIAASAAGGAAPDRSGGQGARGVVDLPCYIAGDPNRWDTRIQGLVLSLSSRNYNPRPSESAQRGLAWLESLCGGGLGRAEQCVSVGRAANWADRMSALCQGMQGTGLGLALRFAPGAREPPGSMHGSRAAYEPAVDDPDFVPLMADVTNPLSMMSYKSGLHPGAMASVTKREAQAQFASAMLTGVARRTVNPTTATVSRGSLNQVRWPFPEPFEIDENSSTLAPRPGLPTLVFEQRSEPIPEIPRGFPVDVYEISGLPVSPPKGRCLPVFSASSGSLLAASSGGDSRVTLSTCGAPFGFLTWGMPPPHAASRPHPHGHDPNSSEAEQEHLLTRQGSTGEDDPNNPSNASPNGGGGGNGGNGGIGGNGVRNQSQHNDTLLLHVLVRGYDTLLPALISFAARPGDRGCQSAVGAAVSRVPGYYARELRDALRTVAAAALMGHGAPAHAIVAEWQLAPVPFRMTGAIERTVRGYAQAIKQSQARAERVLKYLGPHLTPEGAASVNDVLVTPSTKSTSRAILFSRPTLSVSARWLMQARQASVPVDRALFDAYKPKRRRVGEDPYPDLRRAQAAPAQFTLSSRPPSVFDLTRADLPSIASTTRSAILSRAVLGTDVPRSAPPLTNGTHRLPIASMGAFRERLESLEIPRDPMGETDMDLLGGSGPGGIFGNPYSGQRSSYGTRMIDETEPSMEDGRGGQFAQRRGVGRKRARSLPPTAMHNPRTGGARDNRAGSLPPVYIEGVPIVGTSGSGSSSAGMSTTNTSSSNSSNSSSSSSSSQSGGATSQAMPGAASSLSSLSSSNAGPGSSNSASMAPESLSSSPSSVAVSDTRDGETVPSSLDGGSRGGATSDEAATSPRSAGKPSPRRLSATEPRMDALQRRVSMGSRRGSHVVTSREPQPFDADDASAVPASPTSLSGAVSLARVKLRAMALAADLPPPFMRSDVAEGIAEICRHVQALRGSQAARGAFARDLAAHADTLGRSDVAEALRTRFSAA